MGNAAFPAEKPQDPYGYEEPSRMDNEKTHLMDKMINALKKVQHQMAQDTCKVVDCPGWAEFLANWRLYLISVFGGTYK